MNLKKDALCNSWIKFLRTCCPDCGSSWKKFNRQIPLTILFFLMPMIKKSNGISECRSSQSWVLILKRDVRIFQVILSVRVLINLMFVLPQELMKMILAVCCSVAFMKRDMLYMSRACPNRNTVCLPVNSLHWVYMNPNRAYGKTMWEEALASGNLIIRWLRKNFRKHLTEYRKNDFIMQSIK